MPCLAHSVYFFVSQLFVSSSFLFATTSTFGPRPAPPCSHTSFRIPHFFSSNVSTHPCYFSRKYFRLAPANHYVVVCYFSNRLFTSAFRLCFLFNQATLGIRPCSSLLPAFQPQSLLHRAFSQSTALHSTSNELFQ